MEDFQMAKAKIDQLLNLFQVDLLELDFNNETEEEANISKIDKELDFDFTQARTIIEEVERDLHIL